MEDSIEIRAHPADLWAFILHPKSAHLTGSKVVNAFRIPGTPAGEVGEQQCIVTDQGDRLDAQIAEIVSIDAPRDLTVRWVTVPGGFTIRYVIDDLGGRSRLTYRLEGHIAAGSGKKGQSELRSYAVESLERVRAAIESGASFGPATG